MEHTRRATAEPERGGEYFQNGNDGQSDFGGLVEREVVRIFEEGSVLRMGFGLLIDKGIEDWRLNNVRGLVCNL